MKLRSMFVQLLSVLVACNYFAFRVEIFEDEYKAHHPGLPFGIAFTTSSLNWETFDKDNAPKAFIIHPETIILFLCFTVDHPVTAIPDLQPFEIIRDKSPPSYFIHI